jgi:hypothetical protein
LVDDFTPKLEIAMKSFALSILVCCTLLLNTAEAKKGGHSATKAGKSHKPKGKSHKSGGHKPSGGKSASKHKPPHHANKGGHNGPKKAGKGKSHPHKPTASNRGNKHHANPGKKPGHTGQKKNTAKGKPRSNKGATASGHGPRKHHFNPKRTGPGKGQRAKKNNALNKGRPKKLGKLTPAQRKKAEAGLARARQGLPRHRRPRRGPSVARKNPVKIAPLAKRRNAFRLPAGTVRKALANGPGRSNIPAERRLANRILNNRGLNPADRRLARDLIRQGLRDPKANRALLNALGFGLRNDLGRRFLNRTLTRLIRWGGGNPGSIVNPGGTIADPTYVGPGGTSFVPPAGFDPSVPAVFMPNNADNPDGPGIFTSLDPSSLGWVRPPATAQEDDDPDSNPDSEADLDQPTIDSVWQNTRTIKVSNATDDKITVYLRYEALDEDGQWQSYPDETEGTKALVYELEPGEVSVLKDGDWVIKARRVHIWASGGSKKWLRYKNQELPLVPEPDDGYAAPRVQTFNISFR